MRDPAYDGPANSHSQAFFYTGLSAAEGVTGPCMIGWLRSQGIADYYWVKTAIVPCKQVQLTSIHSLTSSRVQRTDQPHQRQQRSLPKPQPYQARPHNDAHPLQLRSHLAGGDDFQSLPLHAGRPPSEDELGLECTGVSRTHEEPEREGDLES